MAIVAFSQPVPFPIGPLRDLLTEHFPEFNWCCGDHDTRDARQTAAFAAQQLIIGRSADDVVMVELKAGDGAVRALQPGQWHVEIGRPTTEDAALAGQLTALIASGLMGSDRILARCRFDQGGNWLDGDDLARVVERLMAGEDLSIAVEYGYSGGAFEPRPPPRRDGLGGSTPDRTMSAMVLLLRQRIAPDWSLLESLAQRVDPGGGWHQVTRSGDTVLIGRGSFIAVRDTAQPYSFDSGGWTRSIWFKGSRTEVEGHRRHVLVQAAIDTADADWEAVRHTAMVKTMLACILAQLPGVIAAVNHEVGLIFEPRHMKDHLSILETGHLPIALWSWICPHSAEEGNFCLSTTGLAAFLGHEVEMWNAPVTQAVAEERIDGVMAYLLAKGPVIAHGDTVGNTEHDRPIRCFLGASRAQRPEPMQALFIEFDDAEDVVPRPDLPAAQPGPVIADALLADAPPFVRRLLAGQFERQPRGPVEPPHAAPAVFGKRPGSFGRKGL